MAGGSREKYKFIYSFNNYKLENAIGAIIFYCVFLMAANFFSTTLNNNFNQQNSSAKM